MSTGTHMWTEIIQNITTTRACFTCPPSTQTSKEVNNPNERRRGIEKESESGRKRQIESRKERKIERERDRYIERERNGENEKWRQNYRERVKPTDEKADR